MKILKFGGSSVGSISAVKKVLAIIRNSAQNERIAVVFSAFQGTTDQLIKMGRLAESADENYLELFKELEKRHIGVASDLLSVKNRNRTLTQIKIMLKNLEEVLYGVFLVKELTLKTLDFIMSFGERFSAFIISEALAERGSSVKYIDSRKIIKAKEPFGSGQVLFDESNNLISATLSADYQVHVVTGFIASTNDNETITIGRGGSDYSASILGAALKANEIEIWTDVNGVLTADPRKVKDAFSVNNLTYEEAMELSHFGAKVIHPPTMQPALAQNIPLRIRNTFNPSFKGTLISDQINGSDYPIRGISSIDNISLLQIQGSGMIGATGIAERIFKALALEKINIVLIIQASSEHSICLGILPHCTTRAVKALENELQYELHYRRVSEISLEPDMAVITVVGEHMRKTKGIAGRVFQTLAISQVNISAIIQGSSERNITMVIEASDESRALNALHKSFFAL